MTQQLSLRCRCGRVRGVATKLSPTSVNRVICYCTDCQAFARHLKRADVLDTAGGTDILQMAPANLKITHGLDALRSLRLGPKGLLRWYTDCCRTPVANTVNARVPFVGLVLAMADRDKAHGDTPDDVVGRPIAGIQGGSAIGGLPPGAHRTMPPWLMLRGLKLFAGWFLRRQGSPSPFFDAQKQPLVQPYVLTEAERAAASAV
jgi:hypothetical protein